LTVLGFLKTVCKFQVHFVHQKDGLTADQALNQWDGMAVVAVWFTKGNANQTAALEQMEPGFKTTDTFSTLL
jgi:hypothetical protein